MTAVKSWADATPDEIRDARIQSLADILDEEWSK